MAGSRPYLFYDVAVSLCTTCLRRVEAKIVFQDDQVLMMKRCPEHGPETVLVADDVAYYRAAREIWLKPAEMPERFNTAVAFGCPYDCGLCADHQQHSCLTLIEVTDHCNLRCPVCYAGSGPDRPRYRTMEQIEKMLDTVVASEGRPDVVQISGGEPTLHPQFFDILDAARARPIQHIMVNTNGVRIAQEPDFAARLATYMPGFEVYLQFDSRRPEVLRTLRGADLSHVRRKALEHLNTHDVSATLVVTVQKGLNDDELGDILEFAVKQPCVRGVTFQPVQDAGRLDTFDPATDRITLTEVRRRILEQTDLFHADDIVPVPCHPDCIAMGYGLKTPDGFAPLTGLVGKDLLLGGQRNTIAFERDPALRDRVFRLFSTANSPESGTERLRDLLCCLPKAAVDGLGYRDVFRVIILQFLDAHAFDVRSVKKACVTIATTDGRLVPFDTYNLLYRDALEAETLAPLRAEVRTA